MRRAVLSPWRREGQHKRLFWRVAHRLPGYDRLSDKAIRSYMRSVSWRRAL